jgi:hypothetical protein
MQDATLINKDIQNNYDDLWRNASYKTTPAATETFKLLTSPIIGIETK